MLDARGAAGALLDHARDGMAASRILQVARLAHLPLADDVAARAQKVVLEQVDDKVAVEVLIFDRAGDLVGQAPGW
jgi:hypothetical protein